MELAFWRNIAIVWLSLFCFVGLIIPLVIGYFAVRGLAVVLLLLGKVMVDTGRPHLGETPWVLVIQTWAYVLVVAGIWLSIASGTSTRGSARC